MQRRNQKKDEGLRRDLAPSIAIVGAGAWGTAMAIHFAGHNPVNLWSWDAKHVVDMQKDRTNTEFLPNIKFPNNINITHDLTECIEKSTYTIIAVPSHAFAQVINAIPKPKNGIAWLTKGLDKNHIFLSTHVQQRWGEDYPVAMITGPSFAKEVAAGLPTALVIAGNQAKFVDSLHACLYHHPFRVYKSEDMLGVQWCGAVKNVLAIACGISDGLNFGANAKAALITRGLNEMTRLGLILGGHRDTFSGLAGLGDLVLTCTDNQSRNRRFGLFIGQGHTIQQAEQMIIQVIEGKDNAAQIVQIAKQHQVEMPISEAVHRILIGEISPLEAEKSLLSRPL